MWLKELTSEENHALNQANDACDCFCMCHVFQYERRKHNAHHPNEREAAELRKLLKHSLESAQIKIKSALEELDANTYAE